MRIVFFVVALLALAFWGFAVFDMWAVLTAWPPHAEQYGTGMFGWILDFPLWRKVVWGASVGFGVIGSLMMLARVRGAGPVLLLAWLLLAGGFAYDVALQDGPQNYGQQGVIASAVLIVLAALFAWAGFAATAKSSKPALAASSAPAQMVTAPSPEPTTLAAPPIEVAPAPTPAEAAPTPAEAAPTPAEAAPTPAPAEAASAPAEAASAPTTEAPPTPTEAAPAPIEPVPPEQVTPISPLPDSPAVSAPESASQDVSEGVDNENSEHPQPTSEDKPSGG